MGRNWSPEARAAAAERLRKQNADPEFAAKRDHPAVKAEQAAARRARRAARLGLRLDQMDAYRAARKLGCTIEEAVRDARRQQP